METKALHSIARLARLAVKPDDEPRIKADMDNILGMIDQLQKVDTDQVAAMAHPLAMPQPLREDVVSAQDQRATIDRLAPETDNGLFLVPLVIE